MAGLKSLAPGYIVTNYACTVNAVAMAHTMTTPVNVLVWNGVNTNVIRKDGSNALWSTEMTAFWTLLKTQFHTLTTVISYELWRKDNAAADPQLIATFAPAGLVGTNVTVSVLGGGQLFAFRSLEDDGARVLLIESSIAANQRLDYTAMAANQKAIVDYLLGNTSLFYARGNAYLNTVGFMTTKVYDKIRKKRLGL